MKKFFSLVLALVMALSLTTVAWGVVCTDNPCTTHKAAFDGEHYATLQEAVDAAEAANTVAIVIDLLDDATLDVTAWETLAIGSDVTTSITINGNTNTLTFNQLNSDWNNIATKNGAKLIINNAKITNSGHNDGPWNRHDLNFACDVELNDVTSDKALAFKAGATLNNVTISDANTSDTYAIWIQPKGQDIDINGLVIDMLACSDGRGIKIDNQYINAADEGQVTLDIKNATFKTEEKAAILVKSTKGADITASNCNISGVAADSTNLVWVDEDSAASANLVTVTGATGIVEDTTGHVAQVNGMKYTTVAAAIAAAGANDEVLLLDDSATIPAGYTALANGTVVKTPAAAATDPVLYVADNSAAGWSAYYIATGKTLDKLAQDSSDKCLPCYLIDGDYFVEVKEAAATYKLVHGNKTVFLKDVPSSVVCYVDTASVLTVVDADDAECGDFYVTDLDEDDVYYISYNKKGDAIDGIWVAAKTGTVQILVKGKIVNAEDATSDVDFMDHDWKGYEVANYEYTSVKCSECGKVAKLYANATAAGKKAVPVAGGWITYADATDYGAVSTPSTDKVTSAETFDAGIAMYVGMSVMAAAGSAVVIGKKKD